MSRTLGQPPSLFGIQGKMLLPWIMILGLILFLCSLFNITLHVRIVLGLVGIIAWWLLNGKDNYYFASRLLRLRTPKYRRKRMIHLSLLKKGGGNNG